VPRCRAEGIGVIGYMALLQGVLADIYPTLDAVPTWQRRTRHFDSRKCKEVRHGGRGAEAETNAALEAIRSVAQRCGMTMPEIAVKWALGAKGVACTLVGSRNIAELEKNVRAAADPLDPAIVEELNLATDAVKQKLGRGFDYYESVDNDRTT
jgi:aryl-alcohol dehydrogenase-like predicted oxidoreductase